MQRPLSPPPTHPTLVRELARNLERSATDPNPAICFAPHSAGLECQCWRDPGHAGSHRCLCGMEWGST
jgi:hypothetical protein